MRRQKQLSLWGERALPEGQRNGREEPGSAEDGRECRLGHVSPGEGTLELHVKDEL